MWAWFFSGAIVLGCQPSENFLSYGDSKTVVQLQAGTNRDAYQILLHLQLGGCGPRFNVPNPIATGALARGSHTVAMMKALVDADLLSMTSGINPSRILSNLGSVELATGMPAEADFKADYAYILDAFHTKWPSAQVYVAKPWRATSDADANSIATWIDSVLSTRSAWAHVGHDERIWAKGSDNGATMMYDGLHYSQAGSVECARQWRTILGI